MRKRSQMEIMGLAVIVILIALSMLFVIRFVVMKPPSEAKKTYEHSELASNIISAILETTTDCQGIKVSMTELFRDCALHAPRQGLPGGSYNCIDDYEDNDEPHPAPDYPGPDSCTFLNKTIDIILQGSLEEWNTEYNFLAYVLNDPRQAMSNFSNSLCLYNKESEIYPLPLNPGTVIIKLDICS